MLTMGGYLQSVYLRELTQTMAKHQGYARDVTMVRLKSPSSPLHHIFPVESRIFRCAAE